LTAPASEALRNLVERPDPPRVLVFGDVMLDRFVWGEVGRISPEAPVPVVRVRRETDGLGGAANVAANLRSLGATTTVVGIVGADAAGARVREVIAELGVADRLLECRGRVTTVKTRIVAQAQQVVRVDREDDGPLEPGSRERLGETIRGILATVDALVVSDYDKGVLDGPVLVSVLSEASRRGLPVVIDPKLRNFAHYQPATVITPNQHEAARATASEIRTDEDCAAAARAILGRLATSAVLITRGARGMLLAERGSEPSLIPAIAREVYDVTGAGDTVTAVLAATLASGASLGAAARLANHAAAQVVGKVGTARVTVDELRRELGATG